MSPAYLLSPLQGQVAPCKARGVPSYTRSAWATGDYPRSLRPTCLPGYGVKRPLMFRREVGPQVARDGTAARTTASNTPLEDRRP